MHEILHLCLTLCWVLKMSRYLTESGGLEKHNEKFVARCNDRDMTEIYQEQIVDTSNPEGVENG